VRHRDATGPPADAGQPPRLARAPADAAASKVAGRGDAERWARVQRECSALSDVEKRSTYEMLGIKKESDQRAKEMREVFAPMGQ